MVKIVDDLVLAQWQTLDALFVLQKVGCCTKRDIPFHPVTARDTARYHVNAAGSDFELLLNGPKFWDTRANRGGGGAVDLAMHVFKSDFKRALRLLTATLLPSPATSRNQPAFFVDNRCVAQATAESDPQRAFVQQHALVKRRLPTKRILDGVRKIPVRRQTIGLNRVPLGGFTSDAGGHVSVRRNQDGSEIGDAAVLAGRAGVLHVEADNRLQ
ncbi:hypothetical protein ACMX25_33230 [Caballeronia sp. 15715]|uniref:hypothetical protein n=2 Tax=unclassified Caballeronia TaxID=2646786 RepID=UPI0039E69C1E